MILLSVKDHQHIILPFRDVTLFRHLIKRVPGLRPGIAYGDNWRVSVFFVATISYTQIMVGWVGAPKGAPVSYAPVTPTLLSSPPAKLAFPVWKLSIAYGGCHHGYDPCLSKPELCIIADKVVTSSLAVASISANNTKMSFKKLRLLNALPIY